MEGEAQVEIRLNWGEDADSVPAHPANVVLVQSMGTDLILTIGHATPPIAMASMTPEQVTEHLRSHAVPIRPVTRLVMPESTARVLVRALQSNLPSEPEPEQEASS